MSERIRYLMGSDLDFLVFGATRYKKDIVARSQDRHPPGQKRENRDLTPSSDRFEDAFGDGFRMRAAGVDTDLRVRVRGLSNRVQALHLRPIGRQRTPAVRGQPGHELVERH